jgi:hypothetical protein
MADYSQYNSTNNTYVFSKGPKSLYFGKGDDQLLGVILNVPQTDTDDEWGGTERIAWERVVDQVSQLMIEVEDPYGSTTDGLINQMKTLLGAGATPGYFDTTLPSLTLGSVIVNGSSNKITIGSNCEYTAASIKLYDNFTIVADTQEVVLWYKNNSATGAKLTLADTTFLKFASLTVGSKVFLFSEMSMIIPSGVTLTAPTINATTITATGAITGDTLQIGASITFGATGNATFSGAITASSVLPPGGPFSYSLGASGNAWPYVYANFMNTINLTATGAITGDTLQIGASITFGATGNATFSGAITASSVLPPGGPFSYSLGASSNAWPSVYAQFMNTVGLTATGAVSAQSLSVATSATVPVITTTSIRVSGNIYTTTTTVDLGTPNSPGAFQDGYFTRTLYAGSCEVGDLVANNDIYTIAWRDYSATVGITGFTSFSNKFVFYKRVGKKIFMELNVVGYGDAVPGSNIEITLPLPVINATGYRSCFFVEVYDSGGLQTTPGTLIVNGGTASVRVSKTATSDFTAGAVRGVVGSFYYESI